MADLAAFRAVLAEVGVPQYADIFIAEGFDSWKVLCDITEADL